MIKQFMIFECYDGEYVCINMNNVAYIKQANRKDMSTIYFMNTETPLYIKYNFFDLEKLFNDILVGENNGI